MTLYSMIMTLYSETSNSGPDFSVLKMVSEFSWSERTNSGMVKQQEMTDLDKSFRECLQDTLFDIAIMYHETEQNLNDAI